MCNDCNKIAYIEHKHYEAVDIKDDSFISRRAKTKRKYKHWCSDDLHKLAEWNIGECLDDVYVTIKTNYRWRCNICTYEWLASFDNVLRGTWCPRCSGNLKLCIDACHIAAEWNKGQCLDNKYINANTKYRWLCGMCDNIWKMSYAEVRQESWCPMCAFNHRHAITDCIIFAHSKGGDCLEITYTDCKTKMLWRCKKKHEWRAPFDSIKNNDTWCPECARRNNLNNSKHSYSIVHWKTREMILCSYSYERGTVKYFNANHIDFIWQSKIFNMPGGRTYRPDCYLPDLGIWIEIKGYFRKDAEEKWNWFHKEYPNSELWNKTKLKDMGVI